MRRVRLLPLSGSAVLPLAVAVGLGGCELDEVVVPPGDPIVLVHAVIRPDRQQQFVVVERSFSGLVDPNELSNFPIPGGQAPHIPLEDAVVTVTNLDLSGGPCGDTVPFGPTPGAGSGLIALPGVYWAPPSCPTMQPGDRLALRVETPDGEVVTGTTRLPGLTRAAITLHGTSTSIDVGAGETLEFNRDRDTLRIHVEPIAGRLMQVEVRRTRVRHTDGLTGRQPVTRILADTTEMRLPGSAADLFETGDGEDVFRAGRRYALSVALTDSNYYDFVRSANNGITGRGFINHLSGGVGVFGSLVGPSTEVTVVGDVDDPREGAYRLEGTIQGIDVDATLTIYLARPLEESEFSAFLDGGWIRRGISGWVSIQRTRWSVDGSFRGDSLFALVSDPGAMVGVRLYRLVGLRREGSFTLTVSDTMGLTAGLLGELTATQQ